MKITVQGEWITGRVWMNGDEIKPSQSGLGHVREQVRFCWGSYGYGAAVLAVVILLQFTRREKALVMCQAFKREVIAQLPQTDFRTQLDVGQWIAKSQQGGRERGRACKA